MDTRKDYYRILEVGPQAGPEELRQAYRVLVQRYHPEHYHMSDKTLMNARLQELNEAYEVLSNPTARSRYDQARQLQDNSRSRKSEPWQTALLKILMGALIGYIAGLFLLRPLIAVMGLPGALMLLLAALLFFRIGIVPWFRRS